MTTDAQVPQITDDLKAISTTSGKHGDVKIAREAENALARNALVPQDSVRVSVDDAWIRLTGEVGTLYQKWSAGTAVRNIAGIRGVTNEIEIQPEVSAGGVWREIENALVRNARLDA
jgi:osmotically-inducible protein OsmY